MGSMDKSVPTVPATAKQGSDLDDPRTWSWVETSVWTERMLAAPGNGVEGGKKTTDVGQTPSSLCLAFSPCMKPTYWRANPDEEDHRLESRVRENRTHGSEGGEDLVLPDPYQGRAFLGCRRGDWTTGKA